jgi:hypothetical protein
MYHQFPVSDVLFNVWNQPTVRNTFDTLTTKRLHAVIVHWRKTYWYDLASHRSRSKRFLTVVSKINVYVLFFFW